VLVLKINFKNKKILNKCCYLFRGNGGRKGKLLKIKAE
jgi:hypothetical protein